MGMPGIFAGGIGSAKAREPLIMFKGRPINSCLPHLANSAALRFKPFVRLTFSRISPFLVSSPSVRKALPSLVMVMRIDLSGAALDEIELGGFTASTSAGFCFVANIKKDNKRKATSHMAVISTMVLFRAILTFGISI